MQVTITAEDLKESIQALEARQKDEWCGLKKEFYTTYENLKPVNIIKGTISELATAPDFKKDILKTSLSMVAGYVSKKMIIGETLNPVKQLLGSILEMSIANFVSKYTSNKTNPNS